MNVRYLHSADSELQETIDYYNDQRARIGISVRGRSEGDAVVRITNYPFAWTPLSKSTRRAQVHRFPYSIIYEVQADKIVIVAIQHQSPQAIQLAHATKGRVVKRERESVELGNQCIIRSCVSSSSADALRLEPALEPPSVLGPGPEWKGVASSP